jgi:hypothetical protein
MLPDFAPNEHATAVYKELIDSIGKLQPKARKVLLQKLNATIKQIVTGNERAVQRVQNNHTTEEETSVQRVAVPLVTATTDPTSKKNITRKPEDSYDSYLTQHPRAATTHQIHANRQAHVVTIRTKK